MILSAEKLSTAELCLRRVVWTDTYVSHRISLMGALYRAVDAGLRSPNPEASAEKELMGLAAQPGLDILGHDVYAIAMHYAKLAGIVATALRGQGEPWKAVEDTQVGYNSSGLYQWRSACYGAGDGHIRRVVLADRWSDDRKAQEIRSWRTIGETCALRKPILLTAVTIGASHDRRRISPWTRCYQHPKNRTYRFKRTSSQEDFGATWKPIWREDSGFATAGWLTQMGKDGCMNDLVHTVSVAPPPRRESYMREIQRLAQDIARWEERVGEYPPMRLAGCYGFSPCSFLGVCHGSTPPLPENHGYLRLAQAANTSCK